MFECPECGSDSVTMDPTEGTILGNPIVDHVYAASEGDEFGVTADCWDCGWHETKTLTISVS